MKIAVIGSGNIGGTLGAKWSAAGHKVAFGVRNPDSAKTQKALAQADDTVRAVSIGEALAHGDVILIAIPSSSVAEFAAAHGSAMNGKIVIDSTNAFNQPIVNAIAPIQQHAPRANIVRAFNSLGWEVFANPQFGGETADHFFCCEAGRTQGIIERLIDDIGLHPVYVGNLEQVRLVDNLGSLWAALVWGQGKGRHTALRLLGDH